jgi:predicted secreted protein
MGPVSGLVLYAVIWSMVFLIALPIRVQTQGDLNDIVPGTHAGSPEHHHLKKKAWWTTAIALVIWAITATIILSGWITVDDVENWFRAGAWSGREGCSP